VTAGLGDPAIAKRSRNTGQEGAKGATKRRAKRVTKRPPKVATAALSVPKAEAIRDAPIPPRSQPEPAPPHSTSAAKKSRRRAFLEVAFAWMRKNGAWAVPAAIAIGTTLGAGAMPVYEYILGTAHNREIAQRITAGSSYIAGNVEDVGCMLMSIRDASAESPIMIWGTALPAAAARMQGLVDQIAAFLTVSDGQVVGPDEPPFSDANRALSQLHKIQGEIQAAMVSMKGIEQSIAFDRGAAVGIFIWGDPYVPHLQNLLRVVANTLEEADALQPKTPGMCDRSTDLDQRSLYPGGDWITERLIPPAWMLPDSILEQEWQGGPT